jgi:hypothetical protein
MPGNRSFALLRARTREGGKVQPKPTTQQPTEPLMIEHQANGADGNSESWRVRNTKGPPSTRELKLTDPSALGC